MVLLRPPDIAGFVSKTITNSPDYDPALSTIYSSHLGRREIGLLDRRVTAPMPAMVVSTSIPDKNRAAGQKEQG
jgi:hypothetical protein